MANKEAGSGRLDRFSPASHLCAAVAHALFVFDVRSDWTQTKVGRMRSVLLLKFDKNERYQLWQSLPDTEDAELFEASGMGAFWGIAKKRKRKLARQAADADCATN